MHFRLRLRRKPVGLQMTLQRVLAVLALAALCAASSTPSLVSRGGNLVARIPEGRALYVEELDDSGAANGEPVRVVTTADLAALRADVLAEVAKSIANVIAGDYEGLNGALIDAAKLEEALLAEREAVGTALSLKADAASLPDLDAEIRSMLDEGTDSDLGAALAGKADAMPQCGCFDANSLNDVTGSLSALEEELTSLANVLSNATGRVVELEDIKAAELACHKVDMLYSHLTGECVYGVVRSCAPPSTPHGVFDCPAGRLAGAECTLTCGDDFAVAGTSGGVVSCNLDGSWAGDAYCKSAPCVGGPDQVGFDNGACAGTVEVNSTCTLACPAGMQTSDDLTVQCLHGSKWTTTEAKCFALHSCYGRDPGIHVLSPIPGGLAVSVLCKDDWMIVDPQRDSGWQNYVNTLSIDSSYRTWGPARDQLVVGNYDRFVDWFKLPVSSAAQVAQSDDCQTITGEGKVYSATGNYVSCFYYNRNCDMLGDYTCRSCTDSRGQQSRGTCTHFDNGPFDTYPWETCGGCCHWWNNYPSIGGNGRFCIAYRPLEAVP
eukprot:m.293706 g.293706  ORF g.293706 m.293706 type:complete len:549 (+) comp12853_c0_seq1:1040-2686(+)